MVKYQEKSIKRPQSISSRRIQSVYLLCQDIGPEIELANHFRAGGEAHMVDRP